MGDRPESSAQTTAAGTDGSSPGSSPSAQRWVTLAGVLLMVAVYGFAGPGDSAAGHYDHFRFAETVERQRDGASYYDAYEAAFAEKGVTFDEIRAYREPAAFVLWRFIPAGWLYGTYLLGVVALTSALLLFLTTTPLAVLPVTAYLLLSGRIPADVPDQQWLLVELWTLPLLAGTLAAWRHQRWMVAAACAAGAVLLRETTLGLLAVGLALVWLRPADRPVAARVAWLAAALGAAVGYGLHAVTVSGRLADDAAGQAVILGTGDPPRTIWEMTGWMIPGPDLVGLAITLTALGWLLRRRHDLLPALGLFAVAGAGAIVARPYWGFLFLPFALLLTGEALATGIDERSRRGVEAAGTGDRERT